MVTVASTTDIYTALSDLISKYGVTRDDFLSIIGLPANGGPNNDGYFPVQVADGSTVLVPSIAKINSLSTNLVNNAGAAITAAVASSTAGAVASATTAATAAATAAANTAATTATNAAIAAVTASLDAKVAAANTSASNANTSASNAGTFATNASAAVTAAATAAANANTSAGAASVFAATANTSATNASSSATAANTSATAASSSASSANASATTANTSAGQALTARDQALVAAAQAGGYFAFYKTYSDANAALSGITANAYIQVLVDETHTSQQTVYQKVSGALVYIRSLTATAAAAASPSSRTALSAISGPTNKQVAYLTESGREGTFVFNTANLSAAVTKDSRQAVYVAPSSDATGASGAWVRKDLSKITPQLFGAVGDGTTDDSVALQAWLDYGGDLFAPVAQYYSSIRLQVRKNVNIRGSNYGFDNRIAGDANMPGTKFRFPANTAGFICWSQTTVDSTTAVNSSGGSAFTQEGAAYSEFSNFAIIGGGGTTGTGFEARTRVFVENVHVLDFGGKGFDIQGSADVADTSSDYGNPSLAGLTNCQAQFNGSHGLHIRGRDASLVNILSFDSNSNGGWGYLDEGLYGSNHVNCHASANALGSFKQTSIISAPVYLNCYVEGATRANCDLGYTAYISGGTLAGVTNDNANPAGFKSGVTAGGMGTYWRGKAAGGKFVRSGFGRTVSGDTPILFGVGNEDNATDIPGQTGNDIALTYETGTRDYTWGSPTWGSQIRYPSGANSTAKWFAPSFTQGLFLDSGYSGRIFFSASGSIPEGLFTAGDLMLTTGTPKTCVVGGAQAYTAWAAGVAGYFFTANQAPYAMTAYNRRTNAGNVYETTAQGPGNTANAPVHTSGSVTGADGFTWRFLNAVNTVTFASLSTSSSGSGVANATTRAAVAAISSPTTNTTAILTEGGRSDLFAFDPSNHSSGVIPTIASDANVTVTSNTDGTLNVNKSAGNNDYSLGRTAATAPMAGDCEFWVKIPGSGNYYIGLNSSSAYPGTTAITYSMGIGASTLELRKSGTVQTNLTPDTTKWLGLVRRSGVVTVYSNTTPAINGSEVSLYAFTGTFTGSLYPMTYIYEAPRNLLVRSYDNAGAGTGFVAADPTQAVYIAPTSDTTGASGAFVRQSPYVTPEMFGAVGNGTANDHAAIKALGDYLNAVGGGWAKFGRGKTYKVGKQNVDASAGTPYYNAENIIFIKNPTKNVWIEGNGASLRANNGLHYGGFNPTTGASDASQAGLASPDLNYLASPYLGMVHVEGWSSTDVLVKIENLACDGNISSTVIGGGWGDSGAQVQNAGIQLIGAGRHEVIGIRCFSHGTDGCTAAADVTGKALTSYKFGYWRDCEFHFNGRNGFSLVGGRGITFERCSFSHTCRLQSNPLLDGPVISNPKYGIDMEPDGGRAVIGIRFVQCFFVNNKGGGLGADSGRNSDVTVRDSTFSGDKGTNDTSYTPYTHTVAFNSDGISSAPKPGFLFENNRFFGVGVDKSNRQLDGSLQEGVASTYRGNIWSDDPAYSYTGTLSLGAGSSFFGDVLFENDVFNYLHGCDLPSIPGNMNVRMRNCTFRATKTGVHQTTPFLEGRTVVEGTGVLLAVKDAPARIQGTFIVGGVQQFTGSKTFTWPSIAAGASSTTTVATPGARLIDARNYYARMTAGAGGLVLNASVTATDTVTITATNPTASAIALASDTLTVAGVSG
jgi:hypothetical protein